MWHDVVNNTINSHRTKNYRPTCVEELTNDLKTRKQQILAILYCRREGTADLFIQLLGTGVLIILASKRLLFKTKQNDPEQLKEYLKLHQSAELELKSLRLVVAHKERLAELIGNIRGKQQILSHKSRKAKAKLEQNLKAEEDSALQRQGRGECDLLLVACKTMTTVLLPAVWLRQILKKLTSKIMLNYLNSSKSSIIFT